MLARIYDAAARAGLLKTVRWISRSGGSRKLEVEWREADDGMLHDLVVGTDITLTGLTSTLDGIRQGDRIISAQDEYTVRDVRLIHDGSETRVTLGRI